MGSCSRRLRDPRPINDPARHDKTPRGRSASGTACSCSPHERDDRVGHGGALPGGPVGVAVGVLQPYGLPLLGVQPDAVQRLFRGREHSARVGPLTTAVRTRGRRSAACRRPGRPPRPARRPGDGRLPGHALRCPGPSAGPVPPVQVPAEGVGSRAQGAGGGGRGSGRRVATRNAAATVRPAPCRPPCLRQHGHPGRWPAP